MKVFQFIDCETHFIAARDETEARVYYDGMNLEEDDVSVKEIPREKWSGIRVRDDDHGDQTVESIVGPDPEREAYLVCSTVW